MSDNKSFEKSMQRLDEIVNLLEKNEQSLDETISLFEECLKLAAVCDEKLKAFELKINELTKEE